MTQFVHFLIEQYGYAGIFFVMVLENIFPPIPSEVVLPLSGYHATLGETGIVGVLIASVLGAVVGALPWYYFGRLYGKERLAEFADRHGRWLTLSRKDINQADTWFDRHGQRAVFLGRFIPVVRTLISLPAGISEMPLYTFLLFTTLGTAIWNSIFIGFGVLLGVHYERVGAYVGPISNIVLGVIIGLYLYRLFTFKKTTAAPKVVKK